MMVDSGHSLLICDLQIMCNDGPAHSLIEYPEMMNAYSTVAGLSYNFLTLFKDLTLIRILRN